MDPGDSSFVFFNESQLDKETASSKQSSNLATDSSSLFGSGNMMINQINH